MQINWPEGLSSEVFLRDYWQQKPLLIKRAFIDFENPLDPNDLAGLAMDDQIPSRMVWQQKNNRSWTLEHGPFSEQALSTLPASGWSLLVSDIEKHLDGFSQYTKLFNFIPDWRIDDLMISTAPDGGSVGPHIDEYDVFLFQSSGARQWQLQSTPDAGFKMIEDSDLKVIDNWSAEETHSCETGDLLYLPPGWGHHGVAHGDQCMTWSFGFRAPNTAELLNSFVDDHASLTEFCTRFTDPGRVKPKHAAEIPSNDLDRLVAMLRGALADDFRLKAWIGCYLSEPAFDEQLSILTKLDTAQLLCRRDDVKMLFSTLDGQCYLFVAGEAFMCSESFASWLCDSYILDPSQCQIDARDRCVLKELWTRGIVEAQNQNSE